MAKIIQVIILFISLLFMGCSSKEIHPNNINKTVDMTLLKKKSFNLSAEKEITKFNNKEKMDKKELPSISLQTPYQRPSILSQQKVSISARNSNFQDVLYSISKTSHLNLIIGNDVDIKKKITLSLTNANLKNALDMIMNMTGCYYTLEGSILHVREYMQKDFYIPYVHTTTSFNTDLGGDTLGSANSGNSASIKGDFKLNFNNNAKNNDFYASFEKNIKELIGKNGHYSLNKFSGVLTVYDNKKNINVIQNFIKAVKKRTTTTILIEAKILEITLNKSHQLGVDWQAVSKFAGNTLKATQNLALAGDTTGSMLLTSKNGDFSTMINALNTNGTIDTLSNPRIKVLSGQSAIISSGKLVPFWEKEVQTDQGTGGSASNTQVTYNRRNVLDGLTMGVTPTVMKNGRIMLNVIPITSSISKVVRHFDENGKVVATAPILNIKEAGTIIKAKDGDLVLIGGLINNVSSKENKSIPLLGDLPWIGKMFTQTNNTIEKKELVILIKLKVVK